MGCHEQTGGVGKTWLAKYLAAVHNALLLENGKSADLKHAFEGHRVVVFDYARDMQSTINYAVIESIKNGYFFSPKYNSCTKKYDSPHVIVFSNDLPDQSKMSADRWDIRDVSQVRIKRTIITGANPFHETDQI